MSSRRNLKKSINESISLLYTDCIFYKVYVIDADMDAADKVIAHISDVHNDLMSRVNITEGKEVKGRVQAYYAKLKSDFKEQLNMLAKEIAALPA